MKKSFLLFIVLLLVLSSLAQKPSEPFSCYRLKKQSSFKSSAINVDNRGDYIDILNYTISLDITDFVAKEISGYTSVRFKAKKVNQNSIDLDFLSLDIDSIVFDGNSLSSYTYNDTLIHINFPTTLIVGSQKILQIFYHGKPVQYASDWGGFFWSNAYAYNVGVSFTEDIHNFGKAWFPCFDNFIERSTFDFVIKTKSNHKAFCNGLLQSETTNLDGTKTWIWELKEEIPTYLASVAVADYATIYDTFSGISNTNIPIQLAARVNDTTNLKASFIHLKDAMESFENRYGKYRFGRIGYCVTSFSAGAMEHATNITYMAGAVIGDTTNETLMAHELSHHWWGNNTTCASAEDMWLNEGFATFSEAVFTESLYGEKAYKDYSRINHDRVLRRTHIQDDGYYPVSGVPTNLTYSSTVYNKGADMIHTLRGIIGDDVFFQSLKDFQENYKFRDIKTDQLENFLSNASSLNLTSFFTTWIKNSGFHHFAISEIETIENNGAFSVQGSIHQKLRETSEFTDFLPIEITFFDNKWNKTIKTAYIYGECSDFQFNLDFEPIFWALDLDEKIQDATVDKYKIISNVGINDFGLARLELDVQTITDSSLVRVTHHFIKPDPMNNKIADLHLSPNRYWSVEGIFSEGFKTNAKFLYNGSTNNNTGFLDNNFINNSENNLVILYRPNANTEWALVDSFEINTQGNINNKRGFITVKNLKIGDYVMAEYDASQAQDSETKTECIYTSIENVERLEKLIEVYPNPSKDFVNIEFLAPNTGIEMVKIYNLIGKEIYKLKIEKQKSYRIKTHNYPKGAYLLSFINSTNRNIFTKKIIVE